MKNYTIMDLFCWQVDIDHFRACGTNILIGGICETLLKVFLLKNYRVNSSKENNFHHYSFKIFPDSD